MKFCTIKFCCGLYEREPRSLRDTLSHSAGGGVSPLDVGVVHAAVVQVMAEGSDQQREHLQVRQLALLGRMRRRGEREGENGLVKGAGPPVWGSCFFSVRYACALITATEGPGWHATEHGSRRGIRNATYQQRKAEPSPAPVICPPRVSATNSQ